MNNDCLTTYTSFIEKTELASTKKIEIVTSKKDNRKVRIDSQKVAKGESLM